MAQIVLVWAVLVFLSLSILLLEYYLINLDAGQYFNHVPDVVLVIFVQVQVL